MSPQNFVVLAFVLSQTLGVQAFQNDPRPKMVVMGQISRVDNLTRSFELKSQQEVNRQPSLTDGVTLGGKIGKTAPGGGTPDVDSPARTFPGNSTTSRPTVGRTSGPLPTAFRMTVFLEDSTICKEGKKVIVCGELKLNDVLQVSGDEKSGPRGRGIYAAEIVRTKQLN